MDSTDEKDFKSVNAHGLFMNHFKFLCKCSNILLGEFEVHVFKIVSFNKRYSN